MHPNDLWKNQRSMKHDLRLFFNRKGCLRRTEEKVYSHVTEHVQPRLRMTALFTYKVQLYVANVCFFGVAMGEILTVFFAHNDICPLQETHGYKLAGFVVLGSLHPVVMPYWKNLDERRLVVTKPELGM